MSNAEILYLVVYPIIGGLVGIAAGIGLVLCIWRVVDGKWLWRL